MTTLYTVDAMNLFCGVADPTNSKHLSIEEVKLPSLEEQMKEHTPGGARVGIEIPVGVSKLEWEFKLTGFDPQVLTQFGLSTPISNIYTAYGVIVDRRTGAQLELKAVAEGRLAKVTQETIKHGETSQMDLKISGITHYEVWFSGAEKIFWDFFTNAWRVDGVDQNAVRNQILRIPNSIIG
jgi:P2 family phage contractile tail tube protein